jgi:transposase-like protein
MASRRFDFIRHHVTSQQRQRLLARYHKSQLTQRDFAAKAGVGLSTLVKWLHQERNHTQEPVSLREVMLPHAPGRRALEVVSPQGWTVRLAQMNDAPIVQQLLSALPC